MKAPTSLPLLLLPALAFQSPRALPRPAPRATATSATSAETLSDILSRTPFESSGVRIGPSATHGHGLIAARDFSARQPILSIPYGRETTLTGPAARERYVALPEEFEGWTGDACLIAMLVLSELAEGSGWMGGWARSLPETSRHPLFWSEDEQEVLQLSSTKKIYQLLDDIEEDGSWLNERIWSKDRGMFPERAMERECFSKEGFRWALAQVFSRSVFLDGELKLIPFLDYANHEDGLKEVRGGSFGMFGKTEGVQLLAPEGGVRKGEEVFTSYGPKGAIEYLLEYGFLPDQMREDAESQYSESYSELTFEIDEDDAFYDDKLDILETETDASPMDTVQTFDVGGREGEPDPYMTQFLRFGKLSGQDAFLLESVFRTEVWGFMADPVSQTNEEMISQAIIQSCQKALDEMEEVEFHGEEEEEEEETWEILCCKTIAALERKALSKTRDYMIREKEALDLKTYYQERRLKGLGLDSEYDGDNPDVGWGQSRAPGADPDF